MNAMQDPILNFFAEKKIQKTAGNLFLHQVSEID